MAVTTSYSFTKPTVGGDTGTWGSLLNANWDKVDDLLDGTTTVNGIVIGSGSATLSTCNASAGTLDGMTITDSVVEASSLTASGRIIETAQPVSGASPSITPGKGTIVRWTLTASTVHTPTITLSNGESIALIINAASGATITWPTMSWFNGEPTLDETATNMVELFRDAGTLYGVYVGSVS